MARLGSITLNEIELIEVDASPIVTGLDAPSGSLAILTDGTSIYLKQEGDVYAWSAIAAGTGSSEGLQEQINLIKNIFVDTNEPTGFVDRSQSTLTFDNSTRTLTISPVSGSYFIYIKGVKIEINAPLSLQIPNTSGSYFFYINASKQLNYLTTFSTTLFSDSAYVAYVLWDTVDSKAITFAEERHGIILDSATHSYLHTTRGTQLLSGFSMGFTTTGIGDSNADAQISLSDGAVADEDIRVSIVNNASPSQPHQQVLFPVAKIPVYYRDGSAWRKTVATDYPLVTGVNRAKYNKNTAGVWSLEEAPLDKRVLVSYIFATTNLVEPIIALLGQDEYKDIAEAETKAAWSSISFGDLPVQEIKFLYLVIYETDSAFTNASKCAIREVKDYRFGIDREVSATSLNTDHSNLSGLGNDDHLQYLPRTGERAMTGPLSMGTNKITNLGTPTATTDAATKSYVDTQDAAEASARAAEDLTFLKLNGTRTMTGDLELGTFKINNVGDPATPQGAATKNYVDTKDALKVSKAGDTMTGALSMSNNNITNLATPIAGTDAATKSYVDTQDALKVSKSGDTMSGTLNMNNNDISNIAKVSEKTIIMTPTYTTATTNGTLTLDSTSSSVHFITGTATGFVVRMPNATTLANGTTFEIYNRTTAPITIRYFDNTTTLGVLDVESVSSLILQSNATTNGIFSPFTVEIAQAAGILSYNSQVQTTFTTASLTDVDIPGTTITPVSGEYYIAFSGAGSIVQNNSLLTISLYKAGVQITGTERQLQAASANYTGSFQTQTVVSFNGAEALTVRVRSSTGNVTVNPRSTLMLRLGPA